jgi:DNA-binding NarL/FixJ family response regulator
VRNAPRVLIADDHAPTRTGTRLVLEDAGFEIAAEVGNADAAVAAALRERPDACLLDVTMPGGGISAAARISRELPETVVVMLTVSTSEDDLFDALRAGAAGYLLKDMDPERLPDAVRGVLAGEAAIPRRLVRLIVDEFGRRRRRRLRLGQGRSAGLTPREWEIVELIHDGASTRAMAERLAISQVTVRRHVSEVMRKLQVPDRAAVISLLGEAGDGDGDPRSGP